MSLTDTALSRTERALEEARARVAELEHHIETATYPVEQHDSMVRDIETQRDAARAEVERLTQERDEALTLLQAARDYRAGPTWDDHRERVMGLETEVERLREALREVLPFVLHIPFYGVAAGFDAKARAEAVLAGSEGSPVETRRALAERVREAAAKAIEASALNSWRVDADAVRALDLDALVGQEEL